MKGPLSDMGTEDAAAGAAEGDEEGAGWVNAVVLARPASNAIDNEKPGDNLNDKFIE